MSFPLECPEAYDLLKSVHSWVYPDIQPTPEITGPAFFGRRYGISGDSVAVFIEQSTPGSDLQVTYSPDIFEERYIRDITTTVLGLSVNTSRALHEISRDPVTSSVASSVRGIRPYQSPTAFEALAKSVIQQQVSYRAACVVTKRLTLELGSTSELKGHLLYSFPSAQAILDVGENGLRKLGLGYRAPYLLNVCKLETDGLLDTESLRMMSYSEVQELLKRVHGIGEWTIQALSVAALGKFDVFPYSDLAMRNLLGRLYQSGVRMTPRQVREKADTWSDGPLVLYLLMCAEVLGLLDDRAPEND